MKKINTAKTALSALFCAIICVLAQISVITPFGIPLTFQTFAVSLCGCMLGAAYGTVATAVYVILGAAGMPVFTLFRGGAQILFGITGGFIFGFIPLAFFCGLSLKLNKTALRILSLTTGIFICHLVGMIQFKFVSGNSFLSAFLLSSLPYLLKDVFFVFFAYFVSQKIRKKAKSLL